MPGSLECSASVIALVIWGIPRAGTTLVVRRSSVERQEASMDCYSNVAYISYRLSDKTRQNRLKNGQNAAESAEKRTSPPSSASVFLRFRTCAAEWSQRRTVKLAMNCETGA